MQNRQPLMQCGVAFTAAAAAGVSVACLWCPDRSSSLSTKASGLTASVTKYSTCIPFSCVSTLSLNASTLGWRNCVAVEQAQQHTFFLLLLQKFRWFRAAKCTVGVARGIRVAAETALVEGQHPGCRGVFACNCTMCVTLVLLATCVSTSTANTLGANYCSTTELLVSSGHAAIMCNNYIMQETGQPTILSLLTPFLAATSLRSFGSVAAILKTDTGLPSSLEVPPWCSQQPHAWSYC